MRSDGYTFIYQFQIIVGVHDSRSIFQLKNRVPIDDTYKRMMNVKKYADVVSINSDIFLPCEQSFNKLRKDRLVSQHDL